MFLCIQLTDFSLFHWHSSFNFDKREICKIRGKFGEVFFQEDLSDILLDLVIRPRSLSVVREEIEKTIRWKEPPGKYIAIQSLLAPGPHTLDKLPSELIFTIFEDLEGLWEVIMLTLTCSRFWILGQRYLSIVRDLYIMFWSGCRIACLGDYAYYPPGMDNHKERETYDFVEPKRVIYSFLKKTSKPYKYPFRSIELRVVRMLLDRPKPASPVYRNLTKREYIREDIDMMGDHVKCSFFGRVLFAHICWSSDGSISMKFGGGLHQGKWAGDRIDCVELQDLDLALDDQSDDSEGDLEERPWKDITSEAYSFLHDIYKVEDHPNDRCCNCAPF